MTHNKVDMRSVVDKFHVTGALYRNGDGCFEIDKVIDKCLQNVDVKCEGMVSKRELYNKRSSLYKFNTVSINPSYILPYLESVKENKFCIGRIGLICVIFNDEVKVFVPCY